MSKNRIIDEIDLKILNILQKNARTPNAEIARQVEMAPSGICERIRKLEEEGIIEGYEAKLNAKKLGLDLVAFVFVRAEEKVGEMKIVGQLASIPQVQEVHHIAGEDCYLVKVRTAGTQSLWKLLHDRFGRIPAVEHTRTTIVLSTWKETAELPLAGGAVTEA